MKKYLISILLFTIFEIIAVSLWLSMDKPFYLFNFTYIGVCLAIGVALFENEKKYARRLVQFTVGSYMLIYIGFICQENMQIEGFWYYLFLGVFKAGTLHYAVAKILGPLIFGRGWCGYACWTAMILDIMPYKKPKSERKNLGFIRYIIFVSAFLLVSVLFIIEVTNLEKIIFWLFVLGNLFYYAIGIILAFVFKDNRAFCKYVCPITVFLKPMSYYSILRIHCDEDKCIQCGKCLKVCPMNVEVNKENYSRKNGTECILCYECVKECPVKALH